MTWKIGSVTLPLNPRTISFKQMVDVKTFRQMDKLPLILSFGPKTDVLTLEGVLYAKGKTSAQLAGDFIIPLQNMASRAFGFSDVLCDEDMVADNFWGTSFWGSGNVGTAVTSDDTSIVAKGKNSCKVIVSGTGNSNAAIVHNYTVAKDFSNVDFFSWWWYGSNSGPGLWFEMKCPDASNYYYYPFTDDWTGWKRVVLRRDEFVVAAGSPDWSDVKQIQFNTESNRTWYIDRMVAGIGQLVDGPGTRYDSIFFVNSFTHEALKGNIDQFTYKLELWNEDDYF